MADSDCLLTCLTLSISWLRKIKRHKAVVFIFGILPEVNERNNNCLQSCTHFAPILGPVPDADRLHSISLLAGWHPSLHSHDRSDHDDVIKWKHFPRHWSFTRGIHLSLVYSPHKGQWRGALMFSLICAWTNGWAVHSNYCSLRIPQKLYFVSYTPKWCLHEQPLSNIFQAFNAFIQSIYKDSRIQGFYWPLIGHRRTSVFHIYDTISPTWWTHDTGCFTFCSITVYMDNIRKPIHSFHHNRHYTDPKYSEGFSDVLTIRWHRDAWLSVGLS